MIKGSVKYLLYEIYPFTLILLGRQLPRGIPKKSLTRKKNTPVYMGVLTLTPIPSCITLKEFTLT